MNHKLILILACVFFLVGTINAYDSHKWNTDLIYSFTSNNATQCNISKANTPYGELTINQITSKSGQTFTINITSGNFTESGDYCFNIICTDSESIETGSFCRSVTVLGSELTTAKVVAYFLIFISGLLIFAGLLLMGIGIPMNNKRDEMTGYIIAVSNLKYLKILFLCLSYLVALFLVYFVWMVSYSFLDMSFMTNIFRFIFTAMAVLILPLFILFVYLSIANLIRDSQVKDLLERGITRIR